MAAATVVAVTAVATVEAVTAAATVAVATAATAAATVATGTNLRIISERTQGESSPHTIRSGAVFTAPFFYCISSHTRPPACIMLKSGLSLDGSPQSKIYW